MSRHVLVPVIVAALAVAAPSSAATPVAAGGSDRGSGGTSAAAAPVATVIGSITGTTANCDAQAVVAPSVIHPGGPSYTVPHDGVITSVRHQANAIPGGHIRLLMLAGTPSVGVPMAITERSPALTLTPSTVNTFAVRVPVLTGQVLAIHTDVDGLACAVSSTPGDVVSYQAGIDGGTATEYVAAGTDTPYVVNLEAVVEPDADRDGFGDVSQDGCPLGAGTQDATKCKRPNTKVTDRPQAVSSARQVTIKFKSTTRRSTFECRVDDKAFKACTSAFTKRFAPGEHTVRIRATSRVGVPEKKPAKVTFRITQA